MNERCLTIPKDRHLHAEVLGRRHIFYAPLAGMTAGCVHRSATAVASSDMAEDYLNSSRLDIPRGFSVDLEYISCTVTVDVWNRGRWFGAGNRVGGNPVSSGDIVSPNLEGRLLVLFRSHLRENMDRMFAEATQPTSRRVLIRDAADRTQNHRYESQVNDLHVQLVIVAAEQPTAAATAGAHRLAGWYSRTIISRHSATEPPLQLFSPPIVSAFNDPSGLDDILGAFARRLAATLSSALFLSVTQFGAAR